MMVKQWQSTLSGLIFMTLCYLFKPGKGMAKKGGGDLSMNSQDGKKTLCHFPTVL